MKRISRAVGFIVLAVMISLLGCDDEVTTQKLTHDFSIVDTTEGLIEIDYIIKGREGIDNQPITSSLLASGTSSLEDISFFDDEGNKLTPNYSSNAWSLQTSSSTIRLRKVYKENLRDIIAGATIMGAGGGGSPKTAYDKLDDIFENSDYIEVVDPSEVDDDARVVVVAGMGSPAVLLEKGWENEEILALQKIEELLGNVDYVIPVESGGFNSFIPFNTASITGKRIVDGDGAGRAIPELQQTTFSLGGVEIGPIVLSDTNGNVAVLYPVDNYVGEEMARAITTVYGMISGIACYPMTGKQLKDTVISGTLTLNETVGKTIREAQEQGKDPVEEVVNVIDGLLLARGEVSEKTEEVSGGFDFGKLVVGDVTVNYKNENMIAWRNEQPIAMVPDSICWMKTDGTPLTNTDIEESMEVALIGKKCHPKWIELDGFETFRPILEKIGYEGDYIPINELN